MTKRSIAVLVSLIVLAFGVSAFALAPVLLPNDDGSAQAGLTATGAADSATGTATDATSAGPRASPQSGSQAAEGADDDSSSADTDAGGNQSADSQSSSASGSGGSGSGGSGNSSPQQSSQQQPAAAPQRTVTLSIDADTMGYGSIMSPRTVAFSEGETVFDVLSRECRNVGIPLEHSFNPLYNSVYVEGINNLYEFDGGSQSGWMYSVNGWYPNYGSSAYVLSKGDVIRWRYTCNYGSDIGGRNALGS
jgi:hypothetical protein